MISWMPGGSRAGEAVHLFLRIHDNKSDRDDNKSFALQAACIAGIATYHSIVKKALFWAIFARPSFIISKAVACAMYTHPTWDNVPIDYCKGN